MWLFADDMILYIENPKDATRKLLGLINEFGKLEGYQTNIQRYFPFLYTNSKSSDERLRKQSPSPLA